MVHMILDGKKLKEEILNDLKSKILMIDNKLSLAVIKIGDDKASNVYIKQKEKMCEQIGIAFKAYKFPENTEENIIIDLINTLNNNPLITGILIQQPLPNNFNALKLANLVKEEKDVDGLNEKNCFNLINNLDGIKPCTAEGVLTLLDNYDIGIANKHIVIIGRSNLVGKPLFNLLLNRNATVTLCHSYTKNLSNFTKQADILIVAVGKAKIITADMIKEGSIVVDVGINKINEKLYGDTDYENIKDKCKYITPVPGGVGPMTIAALAQNIYKAHLLQNNKDKISNKPLF